MPQIGEQRSANGETRTWDGARWQESAPAAAAPEESGPLSRFFGGALSTSPLNPMNWVRAASNPGQTAANAIVGPLKNASQVPGDLKDVVTNERGGGPLMGRLTSAMEALKHIGGSVPLVGPAGVEAGDKIGNGDIAGGAGELAGLASGALLPDVVGGAPEAISKVGRGVERTGKALKGSRMSVGGVSVPMTGLGAAEALFGSHPIAGTAVAAAPYALEYGGKGLQKVGGALEGLKQAVKGRPSLPEVVDQGNVGAVPMEENLLRPARVSSEVPTAPEGGWDAMKVDKGLPKVDQQGLPAGQYEMGDGKFEDVLGPEGPKPGFDWPEIGKRFEPDASGSHVATTDVAGAPRPSLQGLNQFDAEYPMNDGKLSPFQQLEAEGAFQGDRTTGHFVEGEGGLSDVLAGKVKPPTVPEADVNLDFLTPDPLDPYARMAARSMERFGKRYRPDYAERGGEVDPNPVEPSRAAKRVTPDKVAADDIDALAAGEWGATSRDGLTLAERQLARKLARRP